MLASVFSASEAVYYALVRTVLGMPIALISSSISCVLYPAIAEAKNEGRDITPLFMKTTLALAGIV